jgi:hypothetical protein
LAGGRLGWAYDHLADHRTHDRSFDADGAMQHVDVAALEAKDLAAAKLAPSG